MDRAINEQLTARACDEFTRGQLLRSAAAQAGNAVQEPTPSEAAGAADGIVRAVGNQAAEIQRALEVVRVSGRPPTGPRPRR